MNELRYVERQTCELEGHDVSSCRSAWRHVVTAEDLDTGLGSFEVLYCPKCHLGMTSPHPTEDTIQFLYSTKTSADFDRVQQTPIDSIKDLLGRRRLRRLIPRSERGRIRRVLDFGTGNGRFAVLAAQVFPSAQVVGVDYQPEPPPLLCPESDRLTYQTVAEFEAGSTRYDLIFLRHVLEHTPHPITLMRLLVHHLASDGFLYVEVPNLEAGCARVFGRKWKGYYVPRHLFHYTQRSLARILEAAGLDYTIGRTEMPLMGNMLARLTGLRPDWLPVQLAGVALHPLQLVIEGASRSSTCLVALCRPASALSNGMPE